MFLNESWEDNDKILQMSSKRFEKEDLMFKNKVHMSKRKYPKGNL